MQGLGFRVSADQGFRVKDLGFQNAAWNASR